MKVALLPVILALSACGAALPPRPDDSVVRGRGRALDGDTVAIDFRLSGVDALERRQMCERADSCYPCGKIAQDATARMLRQGEASIKLVGGMSYGRPVAIVSVGGTDVGEALIARGFAVPAAGYLKGDLARASRYLAAFDDARRRRRGIHAGRWIDPTRWRRGDRLACERRQRGDRITH